MKLSSYLTAVAAAALFAGSAFAADVDATKKKEEPAPPPSFWDTVTITGYAEGSATPNFNNPYNGLNFGRLFDDRAGTPTFNQALLTIQRPLDPKATGYDFGFKVVGIVGEDVRYTHYLGELDYAIHSRTQLGPLEAHVLAHLPWVTDFSAGGIDLKVGQFVTPLGAEVITAPDNPFYSHSYIFNFGPFQHTGALATDHVNSWLDVSLGITSGENTSLGWPGDNQNSPSLLAVIALNLLDGKLLINAATHNGPENPKQLDPYLMGWPTGVIGGIPVACGCNPTDTWRSLNDVNVTWKATDKLTFILDTAYYHDNGWNTQSVSGLNPGGLALLGGLTGLNTALIPVRSQGVSAYGAAGYVTYQWTDIIKLGGRLEIFRDNNNFFVAGFPGYFDAINVEHGFAAPSAIVAGPQNSGVTYFSLTAGVTVTPEVPKNDWIKNIILRPEVRWDTTLNGAQPFFSQLNGPAAFYTTLGGFSPWLGSGRKSNQVTIGLDVVVPFTLK